MANLASSYNNLLNFVPIEGLWDFRLVPMKASTAIAQGTAVGIEIDTNDVTGYATKMGTENAAGADFIGILQEDIAATDDDYATAGKLKLVAIPMNQKSMAEFLVGAGTFTAVDVFRTVEFHSDSKSLAVDTAGKGARIEKYLSATRGVCSFPMPNTETA